MPVGKVGALRAAALVCALMVLAGCTGGSGSGSAKPSHPAAAVKAAPAPAVPAAPGPAQRICGQQVLHSPYSYDGAALTAGTSGSAGGLPTFGGRGTDFPAASRIVVVPPGNDTAQASGGAYQANDTVFYFEPGRHIVQGGMFTGDDSAYVGGYSPGAGAAIIDGLNGAAPGGVGGSQLSTSPAGVVNADQTWEYLTIRNYASSVNGAVLGDENDAEFDSGNVYKYDTIGPNEYGYAGGNVAPRTGESNGGGYAIGLGSNTVIEYDCLTRNAQGAFNGSGIGIVISHDEISWNGLGEYPDNGGPGVSPYACGCSGGGKLFYTVNAVVSGDYVHDNYNAGIWLDFDNTGATITDNYVASNWGSGIDYEASYNADISGNVLVGNGWASDGSWPKGVHGGACYGGVSCTGGLGPVTGAGGDLPYAAIYLPNSGGNSDLDRIAVPGCAGCAATSDYRGELLVEHNVLANNFGGVTVYTDTDRFAGNLDDDSSCSVPLGALQESDSATYYQQTDELTGANATISGTSVTVPGGTRTVCSDYGTPQASEGSGGSGSDSTTAPSAGMAVFDVSTGALLGTVASVQSANAFTLAVKASDASGVSVLLSAYGGCGAADYYHAGPGVRSGSPAAYYWDNCIWGSRNVVVSQNTFEMQSYKVTGCAAAALCGYMMAIAFNAGVPQLMQYFYNYPALIAKASGGLGNVWSANTYYWQGAAGGGAWNFDAGLQGTQVSASQWRSLGQDADSKFTG
jgi:hypothetical protein